MFYCKNIFVKFYYNFFSSQKNPCRIKIQQLVNLIIPQTGNHYVIELTEELVNEMEKHYQSIMWGVYNSLVSGETIFSKAPEKDCLENQEIFPAAIMNELKKK